MPSGSLIVFGGLQIPRIEVEHFLTADYKSPETPSGTSGRAEHLFEHFLYFYTKIFGSLEGFMYICKKYSNYGS